VRSLADIGLVGAGFMGHGIGRDLLAKGRGLSVVAHRNRAPVDDLVVLAAMEAATPRDNANAADVILVCVTGSPQFREVGDGPEGLGGKPYAEWAGRSRRQQARHPALL